MAAELIGRDEEFAAITRVLLRVAAGESAVCVIEGSVGIGKTALWNAAVDFASQHRSLILKAHPVEAETAFSFASLGDLLRPILDDVLPGLPLPQRHALETALLIKEGVGRAPDPHAVSVAALTSLELMARERPLVIAIDDLQWLDSPSRVTIQFIARRLTPRMALVATERLDGGDQNALRLEGERLRLGPLSPGALQQLIHRRIGIALPRPVLLRVHEASGGHPFFALEIARALGDASATDVGTGALPVPGNLRELVARRLDAISPATSRALLSVAASTRPHPELIPQQALAEGIAADVLVVEGDRLRFTHPLLGSVLYAEASAAERRAVHERLSHLADDEEEAARHLALSADRPDADIAMRLERAAAHANGRGAPSAAAELMELARALTPEGLSDDRARRGVAAAEFHIAGRTPGAEQALHAVLPATSGNLRARALQVLGFLRGLGEMNAAIPFLEEALTHVEDPRLELRIRLDLSNPFLHGKTERSLQHAERAVELAEQLRDRSLVATAISSQAALRGDSFAEIERAAQLERESRTSVYARLQLAWSLSARGSDAAARTTLNEIRDTAVAAGLRDHNWVMSVLAHAETRAGDPRRALQIANEFHQYAVAERTALATAASLNLRAYAEAWLGDLVEARRDANEAMRIADAAGFAGRAVQARAVLGFTHVSEGNTNRAAESLSAAIDRYFAAGEDTWPPSSHSALQVPTLFADAVEVYARLGRFDEVDPLIRWLERESANPWLRALWAYCRGVVAASRGDDESALSQLADATERLQALRLPLDCGRASLALGIAQRRTRHRADARRSVERALALFERAEASVWAATARRELDRLGGRPGVGVLTASERRVAELVALGRSNKEVAAALSISTKTVEGHLANTYTKLGVSSRTELARKLARAESSPR